MRVLVGLLFSVSLFAAAPAHASDRVVVRFARSADAADRSAARAAADAARPEALAGLSGVQVVTVPEGDAASAARALGRQPGVIYAEPEQRMHAATVSMPTGPDSYFASQWGLSNAGGVDGGFTPAWQVTTGAGQTIAVVDTGVDFGIGDLAANKGTVGPDYVDGDSDPSPEAGPEETNHGTHVAGIAAASLGVHQSQDIAGGAPDAKLMALRALDETGSGYDSDIAEAFSWAAEHGARVVNASLGGPGQSAVLHDAIAEHPNTLFVIAAGNEGHNETTPDYPCADPDPNVVCVAAVTRVGALAGFSNYGRTMVDVGAPGVGIFSYFMGGTLESWDGTSMAAPFVSAAAALAFAANPHATAPQIRQAIVDTARPLSSLAARTVSGGMIDADALVRKVAGLPVVAAPKPPAPPAPAPKPVVVAPAPAPVHPAPVSRPAPAPLHSAKLSLRKPRRHGRYLLVSGRASRSFHGTVTIKVSHARTVRVHVRRGAFSARVRPSRHGRLKVTVSVRTGAGFKSARLHRSVRF